MGGTKKPTNTWRPDNAAFVVLHRLRIRGMATQDILEAATGFAPDQVATCLGVLEGSGFVRRFRGKVEGVTITSSGKTAHAALLQSLLESASDAEGIYARFTALNREFKDVCTSWQIREDGEPNNHSDASYDQAVLARLWVVHGAVATVLWEFSLVAAHFEQYVERLDAAAQRVSEGDHSALLRPLSDSYHDIWMELHQDLRLTLGKSR